jgi:hypothetical protein
MRASYSLSFIALLANLAFGFSTNPPRRPDPFRLKTFSPSLSKATFAAASLHEVRGGALESSKGSLMDTGSKCPVTGGVSVLASMWGSGGVLYILGKAIKRVLPIALEPFQAGSVPLSQLQIRYVGSEQELLYELDRLVHRKLTLCNLRRQRICIDMPLVRICRGLQRLSDEILSTGC